jgi:predicted permease
MRLVRHVLGEATLLAVLGGAAGCGLAAAGLKAWRAWGPMDFPQRTVLEFDLNVLMFSVLLTAMTAAACGLTPALMASREAVLPIGDESRTSTPNRTQMGLQRAFVAAQIGAATMLLVGMLLLTRGLMKLEQVPPGFNPGSALSVQLSLPPGTYGNRAALVRFFDVLRDRLGAIPGVESAGAVSLLPLSGLLSTVDIALPGRPAPPPNEVPQAHLRVATPEYFDAAGIAVLEGRAFDRHDREDGRPVAIVSRAFARRHFGTDRALGKPVQIVQTTASAPLEIVGVVSDVKQFTLDAPATADLYVPLHQMPAFQAPLMASRMFWIVRGPRDLAAAALAIRSAVAQVDPGVAASGARSLESVWMSALGSGRAKVQLLQAFGSVALVLCAIGVYGVAAFAARTRRRELALRAALGATRRDLTMSMCRGECAHIVAGLVLGLSGAFCLAPALFGSPFETNPRDAMTYAAVAVLMAGVAVSATFVPLRRAGKTDPIEALRAAS